MPFLSNYGDVPDKSERLSIPSLVFCILTFAVVTARLYTRASQRIYLQADDWIIVIATLCAEALGVLMILCSAGGFGKHITDLEPPVIRQTLKYFFVSQVVYKMSISFTKLSILCFYRRLFFIHVRFRRICNILMAVIMAWIIAAFFATVFQCTPVGYAYDKKLGGGNGHCINLTASWYSNSIFNITSDFVITLLPMPVISSLQMRRREKFMLCGLFALGFLVCVTSILRATTINLAGSQADRTWQSVDSSMWSVCEANLAIIGSCMPILKKPITRILHLSTRSSTNGQSRSGMINITAQSNMSTKRSGRFSRTVIGPITKGRDGDSSSEEGILSGEVELFHIKKTQEVHMISEVGSLPSEPQLSDRPVNM
ncbi:hypothetical protein CAC42_2552 [Sphaceloma murrayae]|uniref:Rhodopsin domain-containing protein n=1 Tax=Sphaceloma murrayae TaxID=2082308 RepID=A0A2K1QWD7_9PEZI|nr:hypothetical protein CAC42_2552 [Sphaceloma murrayae]